MQINVISVVKGQRQDVLSFEAASSKGKVHSIVNSNEGRLLSTKAWNSSTFSDTEALDDKIHLHGT